jgi:hypothetical protein
MEKNNESGNGLIEKLAMLSDEVGKIFPNGKSVVVYSLNDEDFIFVKNQVGNYDRTTNQFKVDISGIEFIFLKDELLSDAEDKT